MNLNEPGMLTSLFRSLWQWGSFVKFSHTIFALPFALASTALAARATSGWPGWRVFGLILVAMVGGRTCAMAFNRIIDRRYDALNPRTAGRHLPRGVISLSSAWLLCGLSAATLVAASWALNPVCVWLSPVALFLVCFYSLTKRFTDFTQVWLGLALAVAPVGAWLAVKGSLVFWPESLNQLTRSTGAPSWLAGSAYVPLALAAAVMLWLIGFDLIYATQDYEFDRRQGLRSLVTRWGPENALAVAFLAHLFTWGWFVVVGVLSGFRLAYWIGLVLILALLLMEHTLARRRTPEAINIAFFKLNATISLTYLVVVLCEILFPWFRLRVYR